jgi:hypothetical protein
MAWVNVPNSLATSLQLRHDKRREVIFVSGFCEKHHEFAKVEIGDILVRVNGKNVHEYYEGESGQHVIPHIRNAMKDNPTG